MWSISLQMGTNENKSKVTIFERVIWNKSWFTIFFKHFSDIKTNLVFQNLENYILLNQMFLVNFT